MHPTLYQSFLEFDPDALDRPVIGLRVDTQKKLDEIPFHKHRKGQLVIAQKGGVTCEVPSGLWMVPPQCGVWIPSGMLHSNRVTANASIIFLYVETDFAPLPDQCCTLAITPLLFELILRMASIPPLYALDGPIGPIVTVLLNELSAMPTEQLHLPATRDSKLRLIADALMQNPADRRTIDEWADHVAMSSRSLMREVKTETGMSFGRWRQQLHIIIALQRLAAGDSVQNVAEVLGYESVSAFITMFKKALGVTPFRYFSKRGQSAGERD